LCLVFVGFWLLTVILLRRLGRGCVVTGMVFHPRPLGIDPAVRDRGKSDGFLEGTLDLPRFLHDDSMIAHKPLNF